MPCPGCLNHWLWHAPRTGLILALQSQPEPSPASTLYHNVPLSRPHTPVGKMVKNQSYNQTITFLTIPCVWVVWFGPMSVTEGTCHSGEGMCNGTVKGKNRQLTGLRARTLAQVRWVIRGVGSPSVGTDEEGWGLPTHATCLSHQAFSNPLSGRAVD
jgi:hypothetical protein